MGIAATEEQRLRARTRWCDTPGLRPDRIAAKPVQESTDAHALYTDMARGARRRILSPWWQP